MLGVISTIRWPLYVFVGLYVAFRFIDIPSFIDRALYYLLVIVTLYYAVKMVQSLIDWMARRAIKKQEKEKQNAIDTSAIDTLSKVAKTALWIIAAVLLLSNLGYNVSTLIAGLGIGGIAIAFALQNILSDIFSSFSIYFDKPFQSGDFIIVGDDMGVVERIGIKSTRLRTLQGEELVLSNKELTSARVHNFKKLRKRRVVFMFGVTYETSSAKLQKIPALVREICAGVKNVAFDRAHFKNFGDFSLNYEVVYYLESGDYNEYMNVQQTINLALKERFEKEKIEFAYPTQVLYMRK